MHSASQIHISQPLKNPWSAQNPFICLESGKELTGDVRTRRCLGRPCAAGPEQLEAARSWCQRGRGAALVYTGTARPQSSLCEQPTPKSNSRHLFGLPPRSWSLLVGPEDMASFPVLSLHYKRVDQQPDIKTERLRKLISSLDKLHRPYLLPTGSRGAGLATHGPGGQSCGNSGVLQLCKGSCRRCPAAAGRARVLSAPEGR